MKKVEIELLFEKIKEKEKNNEITIVNEDLLKSELERIGVKKNHKMHKDLLTREQYNKIKDFNKIDSIITRKADKSNVFVILDKIYYNNEINQILGDETKFKKIRKDPTEAIKK